MGTGIRINLEYFETPSSKKSGRKRGSKSTSANPVIANRFCVPRDHELFAALVGARSKPESPPLFNPRGLPKDVSMSIFRQFYVQVVPENVDVGTLKNSEQWCYESDAEKWQALRASHGDSPLDERHGFIQNPELHTRSYLHLLEIEQSLEFAKYDTSQLSFAFRLVLDCMKSIDDKYGKYSSRMVFWFYS